jgi:hypothetical protein
LISLVADPRSAATRTIRTRASVLRRPARRSVQGTWHAAAHAMAPRPMGQTVERAGAAPQHASPLRPAKPAPQPLWIALGWPRTASRGGAGRVGRRMTMLPARGADGSRSRPLPCEPSAPVHSPTLNSTVNGVAPAHAWHGGGDGGQGGAVVARALASHRRIAGWTGTVRPKLQAVDQLLQAVRPRTSGRREPILTIDGRPVRRTTRHLAPPHRTTGGWPYRR